MIVVFSKDRLDRLVRTLPALARIPRPILLLDDSSSPENQFALKKYCLQLGVEYHGPSEQERVISLLPSRFTRTFFRRLGSGSWNLGFNRNYAIAYALIHNSDKLLLCDDDMQFHDSSDVDKLFAALDKHSFAGATIVGMRDDSIVGHLFNAVRVARSSYVSGSCLAVRPEDCQHYFINDYNEDWIWLLMESEGREVLEVISAMQLPYDPYCDLETKCVFQEFGEILWEGLFWAYRKRTPEQALDHSFWEKILKTRREDISTLHSLDFQSPLKQHVQTLFKVLSIYHDSLQPSIFVNKMVNYYDYLPLWREFVQTIPSQLINSHFKNNYERL